MSQAGIISVSESQPSVPITFVCNVGSATAAANILEVLGQGGTTTTGSGNVIDINVSSAGFTWNPITSADNVKQIQVQNGYITNGVANCILILPLTSAVGDTFIVTGNTSLFQVTQNAGQQIFFGVQSTTSGVGGSVTSSQVDDHLEFLCVQANVRWKIISSIGNLTIV